ncbi:cation diffusion facilitator family transporter [Paenibacillus sp. 1001270B_150601_E10]|uniref:cation diffusion facilitator family transporter n=1 Tax=Paenibacillus sp. 1001270B_150601_E10 TaxID=2787079 RepID=UPI0018A0D825|nr:cation diffusion facilitator family transporter [Paenibacillus sp. 1001270B_150601_E10]
MAEGRLSQAEKGSWISMIVNAVVAVIKAAAAFFSGSFALLADAVHSLSDSFCALAVWSGLKLSKKPPERKHPYGYGKRESVVMILVAVWMFVVGIELIMQAGRNLYAGEGSAPSWYAFAVLLAAYVIKAALHQYRLRQSKSISSRLLLAYAAEHRFDIIMTVIVLTGMTGALLGYELQQSWLMLLDPIAGAAVAVLLLWKGYQLIQRAIQAAWDHELMDEEAMPLMRSIQSVDGVILIKELKATEHGHYVMVEVTISVNPNLSVAEGYLVGERVKEHLMHRYLHVADVEVHVHPLERNSRYHVDHGESSTHWIQ